MEKSITRVLVLGASGMLGSALFRAFNMENHFKAFGSIREPSLKKFFAEHLQDKLIDNVHLEDDNGLLSALSIAKPDLVINCIGIIKQVPHTTDSIQNISINSLLPHRLAMFCEAFGARLVHFSTDCVFSGKKGNYKEDDFPDAYDLYGRTKYLGEVSSQNSITLRTSIIGHELIHSKSLVDWFLSQNDTVKGYTRAVFSGLPTIEVARVIMDFIIPNKKLNGLYHLSVDPISKYDLLNLIAIEYQKSIKIIPDDNIVIDRSLISERFRIATGFKPKSWPSLIKEMHKSFLLTH